MTKNSGVLFSAIEEDIRRQQSIGRAFDAALAQFHVALDTLGTESRTLFDNLASVAEDILSLFYRSSKKMGDELDVLTQTASSVDKSLKATDDNLHNLSNGVLQAHAIIVQRLQQDWQEANQDIMGGLLLLSTDMLSMRAQVHELKASVSQSMDTAQEMRAEMNLTLESLASLEPQQLLHDMISAAIPTWLISLAGCLVLFFITNCILDQQARRYLALGIGTFLMHSAFIPVLTPY